MIEIFFCRIQPEGKNSFLIVKLNDSLSNVHVKITSIPKMNYYQNNYGLVKHWKNASSTKNKKTKKRMILIFFYPLAYSGIFN